MFDIFTLLHEYIEFFPLLAFLGLLLAGLNVPLSEDLIIITGALLSHEKESSLVLTLVAIYVGAICSDYFGYWIGRRVRSGAAKTSIFLRVVPERALEKMCFYLDRYGILTFIVCRFIPFGARNMLFFTAGFSKLRLRVFALYEFIAAMISINTLFFLTYHFGDEIKRPMQIAGIVLFMLFVLGLISVIIRVIIRYRMRKRGQLHG